jgi:hypothetical protein
MSNWTRIFAAAAVLVAVLSVRQPDTDALGAGRTMLAHNVYFSLKDASPAARERLVAACQKYLKGHPGEVFFAAGTLVDENKREVNDRNFEVALHIVFRTKADYDKYAVAERQKAFIAENESNWAKVRVFDSYVE